MGTGSSVPDCSLCKGYRSINVKTAYAKGWKKSDLTDIEDDGFCECPQCYDDAATCMFCYGEGDVSQFIKDQQRNRVLITARGGYRGRIPPCFRHGYNDGRIEIDREIYLLSKEHTRALRDDGLINWFCSVFGDEIYLTPKGEEEARKAWREYRDLCRKWLTHERERRIERQLISIIADQPRVAEAAF
jgi:hypothetical protein